MTSDTLYNYCEARGIETFRISAPLDRSMSAYVDGIPVIGIDDRGMTEAEKKVHLAHEIGHCECMAFYRPYTPLEPRSKVEHAANSWAIKKILPKEDLLKAMQQGGTEIWQLAEIFDVTEDLVRFAVWEYFDKEV